MTSEELDRLEALVGVDPEPIRYKKICVETADLRSLIALARVGLAVTPRPIDEAPKDGLMFLAYSQDLSGNGLTPFWSGCAWHEDAGFCTDEIREPTHFIPLSSLPKPGGE